MNNPESFDTGMTAAPRQGPPTSARLAFYDMDRTVTFTGTYTRFLLHVALALSPWRLVLTPLVPFVMLAYILKWIDRARLKELNQVLLIGRKVPRSRLTPLIDSYAQAVCAGNVRAGAIAQITADKAAGYTLILASASYRIYVEAIAQRLGFDAVIATDHVSTDLNYLRARISGDNCYDAGKLRMIQRWMADQGIARPLAHIRAYSDHVSDAPMLEFADEAFAANPHKPLAALARVRGWTVVKWD